MNIAILHYHLRPGGVASVIRKEAELLRDRADCRAAILSGTAPDGPVAAPVFVVPELDYDALRPGSARSDPRLLADRIASALRDAFPSGCDLLHAHNATILKNRSLAGALGLLVARGMRLLVHVHDLAEDFRPDVFDAEAEYPARCDYAVINNRDRDRLVSSGLAPGRVHVVPNPVSDPGLFEARSGAARELAGGRTLAVYPVRAIRRKNLGEALLLSRFLPAGAELALTLPPTSAVDRGPYDAWRALAAGERLPVRFEVGLSEALDRVYAASFRAVTTSVKEGFGYAFVDPIVRGVPVVGRALPHIEADFAARGVRVPGLYRALAVPAGGVDRNALRDAARRFASELRSAYAAAFAPGEADELEEALGRIERRFAEGSLDFGALDRASQASVVKALGGDAGLRAAFARLNPFLEGVFETAPDPAELAALRKAILAAYSPEVCADALLAAYRSAAAGGAAGVIDRKKLVAACLEPESCFLSAT